MAPIILEFKLQAERDSLHRREKEMCSKFESVDVAWRAASNVDSKITELETKLQECLEERNDIKIRLE